MGAIPALVVNVSTPDEDTLNVDTGEPLKLKLNGMVSTGDQVGELLPPANRDVHEASRPEPLGYSLSLFNPPGLP